LGAGGELVNIFQRFADKYDAAKDRRLIGDGEKHYIPISCRLCEDEGFVYFNRVNKDGARYWLVARCTCGKDVIPATYRFSPAKGKYQDGMDIPRWDQVMTSDGFTLLLTSSDIICARLQPYAAETGLLPFPCPEPLKVNYRRKPPDDPAEYDRRQNQDRANREAGR